MAKRRKKSTGAKRMREQGYVRCDVWFSPEWMAIVRHLAAGYGAPLATFLRLLALAYSSTADERKAIRLQLQMTEWHAWNALITVLPARSTDDGSDPRYG
jgi:hypothetical protein